MDQQYYKQKKILLVDDEKALLDMVADFLREDGYTQIKTAGTVAAATDAAKTWKPDFAILDVMLPDGDGISDEQLEKLRNTPHYMMSDNGTEEPRHGLGLLIVRQIMRAHRGDASFGHSASGGFLAALQFPREQAPSGPLAKR